MSKQILILPGDGIGPEIVDEAVKVLACLRDEHGLDIDMDEALVGGAAINRRFGAVATTADGTSIDVLAPENPTERVAFVAKLGAPLVFGGVVGALVFDFAGVGHFVTS